MHDYAFCVAGPPGAGKTTVVVGLGEVLGCSVFRLRDEVRRRPELVTADPGDRLGWVDDASVARVLDAASDMLAAGPHPVLLDNFPGRLGQLDILSQLARRLGIRCGVLEMVADDTTLQARLNDRWVCPRCQPDLHTPAQVSSGAAPGCALCGTPLLRREGDRADVRWLRIARYRANLAGLEGRARDLGLPYVRVNAGRPAAAVQRDAREAVLSIASDSAENCRPD